MRPRSIRWRVRLRSWMLAFALLSAACIPPAKDPLSSSPGISTTIVLVRHAERDPGEGVPLNAEGLVRREALRDALSENGITAIFCTDTLRNRQTVEPLAELLGLEIHLVSPLGYLNAPGVADQLVQEFLTQHAGGTILFCGNVGSTIGTIGINAAIYQRLGGTGRAPERYQDLYVVVVPEEGVTRFIKTQYGGKSSLD